MLPAILVLAAALCATTSWAQSANPKRERLSIAEFVQDPARVKSLRAGFKKMIERNSAPEGSADYRRSLKYWAAVHGYLGPDSSNGQASSWPPAFAGEPNWSKPPLPTISAPSGPVPLSSVTWDQCTHGNAYFLPWHRFYLYFFERVLQEAAGDPNLALPYWDYNDPKMAKLAQLFVERLNVANKPSNPLFTEKRTRRMNLEDEPLRAVLGLEPEALQDLLETDQFAQFSGSVEENPHGYVHCALGAGCSAPLMGAVPTSARDPIFYLHHANIDRLWQCWVELYGERSLPGEPWLSQTYTFIDSDGSPKTVKVSQLFGADSIIDFKYQRITSCTPKPVNVQAGLEGLPPPSVILAESTERISITGKPQIVAPAAGAGLEGLGVAPSETPLVRRIVLVVSDVTAKANPGVRLALYVQQRGTPMNRVRAATLSFFGAFDAKHNHSGRNYEFVVTNAVDTLRRKGVSLESMEVVAVPEGVVSSAGEEAAGAVEFRPSSELSIGSVKLEVRGRRPATPG